MTYTAALSGSASKTLTAAWSTVRFCRSSKVKGVWVLLGISHHQFKTAMARLFSWGATLVATGSCLSNGLIWIAFKSPAALSAKLATLFPVPAGAAPLIVSKGRVLSGAAEKQALRKLQPQQVQQLTMSFARVQPANDTSAASLQATLEILLRQTRPLTLAAALTEGKPGAAWVLASLLRGAKVANYLRWQALAAGAPLPLPAVECINGDPARSSSTVTPVWLQGC